MLRHEITKRIRRAIPVFACALLLSGCGAANADADVAAAEEALVQLRYGDALTYAESAIRNGEQTRQAYRLKGIALMKSARYGEAAKAFQEALALSDGIVTDTDYDLNLYLAGAFRGMGEHAEATAVYDHMLALRPADTAGLFGRGVSLLQSGDLSGATRDFDKAVSLAPEDFELRIRVYRAFAQAGYEEAGRAVVRDAYHTYGDALSHYEKGLFAFHMGNNAEAQSNLEKAFDSVRGQERIQAALLLGQTGEKQGDLNYAIDVYSTVIAEEPKRAELYNRRGICLMKQGRYKEAIADFEAGIALGEVSGRQALLRNIIAAHEHAGNFQAAAELMAEYNALYPDDAEAAREAIFLETR